MKLKAKRLFVVFLAALMLAVSVPVLPIADSVALAAVNTAKEAVVRNYPETKQSQVNKMAQDLETAIAGLTEKVETPKIEKIPYEGEKVQFVKDDLETTFGMLTPQDGSTWEIDGDNVVIHIVPSNKTVYGWLHWGAITDSELTKDFAINDDGTLDLTLDKSWCGYAHPVAPVKKKDGKTTSSQYYFAVPPESKLPVKQQEDAEEGTPKTLNITNNVKMLKVNGATLDKDNLVLQMGSDAYNYASVGDIATAEKDSAPIALGGGNTFTIPASAIDKTGKEFYVSLKSKKNGTWYERIFTIDETAETLTIDPSDADYTAVNAAIASIPEDLSIYTEESVKAVNDAKDAVVEKLFKSQQAEVDAMAQAIEDAIAALVEKPSIDKIPYDGNDIKFVKEDLTSGFGMFAAQDGTTCEIDGDNVVIHFVPKNKTTYGGFHWGAITDTNLAKDVTFNTDGTIDLTLPADEYCGYAHPVAPIKKTDETATTSTQYYLAIPAKDKLPVKSDDADYTAVDAALAKVPADLSIYTDETAAAVTAAVNAVVRDKPASEQAAVDAMAQAIEDAVAALKEKEPAEEKVDLYPINDELMFKVVNAYLETKDGKTELVFALNGSGYKDIILATYEDALAKGADKSDWVHFTEAEVETKYTDKKGEKNEGKQKKYQFRVPVAVPDAGETKLAIVSVSDREAKAAEKENPEAPDYSNAFKARQFVINMDAKTIHTGNYEENETYKIVSEIKSFKVSESADVYVFGNAVANEYIIQPTLVMLDEVYDKAFIGTKDDAATATEKIITIGADKNAVIKFYNSHDDGTTMIKGTEPIVVSFHVAKTGEWTERNFSIDVDAKTITVTGEEIKTEEEVTDTPANYKNVDEAKEEAKKIDRELFTEDSVKEVDKAIDAVKENLTADKQKEVNEMADNINAAMRKLKLKDGVYTIPANILGNDFIDVVIEVEGGKMSAYVITSNRVQDKVYPGTVEEAEKAGDAIEKLGTVKNSQGMPRASMFRIPIKALNDTLEYAVHSPAGWTNRKFQINSSDIKKGDYNIIENADGEFTLGEDFTMASDAEFSKFVAVLIDDEVVEPSDYSAVSGSTRVTFNGKYTGSLGEKAYEVKILSHDGIAKTTITGVKKQEEATKPETKPGKEENIKPGTKTPDGSKTNQTKNNTNSTAKRGTEAAKTGDETNAFVYLTIFIAAVISILLVYRRKQR